jgi:hypothetical protein
VVYSVTIISNTLGEAVVFVHAKIRLKIFAIACFTVPGLKKPAVLKGVAHKTLPIMAIITGALVQALLDVIRLRPVFEH